MAGSLAAAAARWKAATASFTAYTERMSSYSRISSSTFSLEYPASAVLMRRLVSSVVLPSSVASPKFIINRRASLTSSPNLKN